MLYKHIFTTSAALTLVSTAAFAVGLSVPAIASPVTATSGQSGFVGGEVGLEYGSFNHENAFDTVTLSSNIEFNLSPKFKFGSEWRRTEFTASNDEMAGAPSASLSSFNIGYALSEKTEVRAFSTQESFFMVNLDSYGVAGSFTDKDYSVSGYTGNLNVLGFGQGGPKAGIYGVSVSYNLSESLAMSFSVDAVNDALFGNSSDSYINRTTIGGSYAFGKGKSVYVKVSQNKMDYTIPTHLKIGITMDIGGNGSQLFKVPDFLGMILSGGA